MTDAETISPYPVHLHVSCDLRQLSDQLCWQFDDDIGNLYHRVGRHAGAVHLYPGARVGLALKVFADRALGLTELFVVRACIESKAIVAPGPSPFSNEQSPPPACFAGFSELSRDDAGDESTLVAVMRSHDEHTVVRQWGRWNLSLSLTVSFRRKSDTKNRQMSFRFDPETHVGSGTEPNPAGTDHSHPS